MPTNTTNMPIKMLFLVGFEEKEKPQKQDHFYK